MALIADAVRAGARLPIIFPAALDDADLGRLDALDAAGHYFFLRLARRRGRALAFEVRCAVSFPARLEPWASEASRGGRGVRAQTRVATQEPGEEEPQTRL